MKFPRVLFGFNSLTISSRCARTQTSFYCKCLMHHLSSVSHMSLSQGGEQHPSLKTQVRAHSRGGVRQTGSFPGQKHWGAFRSQEDAAASPGQRRELPPHGLQALFPLCPLAPSPCWGTCEGKQYQHCPPRAAAPWQSCLWDAYQAFLHTDGGQHKACMCPGQPLDL